MDGQMDGCSCISYQCPRHSNVIRGHRVAERVPLVARNHTPDCASAPCQLVSHPPGLLCPFLKPPDRKATLDIGPGSGPTHQRRRPKTQGYGAAEGASLGCGHHVATEEEAEPHVTMRAWGQQAHTAALGCIALDEFHSVCLRPQIQLAAVQFEHELRDPWGHAHLHR